MGKMDDLMKSAGSNIDESMGAGDSLRIAATTSAAPARWQGVVKAKDVALIPLDRIIRDDGQPREEFDEEALTRLADSLRIRGQLQPIRVRWDERRGSYILVVGERRWRAARMAGLQSLSCVITEGPLAEAELLAVQLVETALREDLKPVEQARAYKRLMDANGWASRQLASELNVSQAAVVKALALLDLPPQVQEAVEQGALAPSVAYEVARLETSEAQTAMAEVATSEKLTRDEVALAVRAVKANRPAPQARPDPITVDIEIATVTVKWKKGSEGQTLSQLLRRALKTIQSRERDDQAA